MMTKILVGGLIAATLMANEPDLGFGRPVDWDSFANEVSARDPGYGVAQVRKLLLARVDEVRQDLKSRKPENRLFGDVNPIAN